MNLRAIFPAAILLSTSLLFTSCNRNKIEKKAFSIVTTTFPCYDAARTILGKHIENPEIQLSLLVKPGTEVHSYDPTPQDLISIENCDLFIFIGGESDEWVEELLKSNNKIDSSKYLALFDCANLIEEKDFTQDEEESENEFEADEHIWNSPVNEKKIINAVCKAISKAAENKNLTDMLPDFEKNASLTLTEIDKIEIKTKKIIDSASNKMLIMADRFPLAYFTDYYGISVDAAFSGCSTAVETSVTKIATLIDEVRSNNLAAVFFIELSNHKIADIVAEETGVPALCLQSMQNVTKTDFDNGETWLSLMNKNAETLAKGLK